ncbi:MAG: purine-nucleoside phosphorylase [Lactobacillus sp.]|jgi:inosine/guanosine/xanthosine phosphorylase family protein|nr:purine-nucleoside phosphorylase [Lactobacillus sp.]
MIDKIAKQIKSKLKSFKPETLIILGSGLGSLADDIKNPITIPYSKIEGFPQSTVSGHKGNLIIGSLEGKDVICMQGRFHLYEGYPPQIINTVFKAFKLIGIKNLVVTNAAGSLSKKMPAGSIMLISDHINFSGQNPLIGPNDDKFGPRFPDVSDAYHTAFRSKAKEIAKAKKIKLHEGTYLMVIGPNFETAAEIKAFQILGANAVGMSTVPEVLCAVYCGMKVLGFSVITNLGTGLQTSSQSHSETLAEGQKAAQKLTLLVKSFVKET